MNARRVLGKVAVVLGAALSLALLVGAGATYKVLSRPRLSAIVSTTAGTVGRQACLDCHAPIADEWRQSFHSRSLTGPYWAQVRQLGYLDFFDRFRKPCVNCHAPANVLDLAANRESRAVSLGVECTPSLMRDPPGIMPAARSDAVDLGVDCTSCHVSRHGITGAGTRPTDAHRIVADRRFQDPVFTSSALCRTCHGATVKAWERTGLAAEGVTCVSCHMPVVRAASVTGGPERTRRSHSFPADKDSLSLALAVNASLEIVDGPMARLRIVNDRVGHYFPSGGNFLSVRMTARDSAGRKLKEQKRAFGRNEDLVLDFWPFNWDTRIAYGRQREIRFPLPGGHGTVEAVIRYHDWIKVAPVVRTLREDY